MSGELLKINKLPILSEFKFILLEVLDRNEPIQLYDFSTICKAKSINLAMSFTQSIDFLRMTSLIYVLEDDLIQRNLEMIEELRSDYFLCTFLTKRLIEAIKSLGVLDKIFNDKVIKFDFAKDSYSININSISLSFPIIKLFLLNMGIAYPDKNTNSKILIHNIYKQLFVDEILFNVIGNKSIIDLDNESVKNEVDKIENNSKKHAIMRGINVFISYSHRDEAIKEELENHFSGLRRNGLIKDWNDRMIQAGDIWDSEIKEKLEKAEIIIFLISSDFMASDYINNIEIKNVINRHNRSLIKIVPIIARPCDFVSLPISKYQALPKNARAITSWENRDEAYLDIVNQFKTLISILSD